MSDSCPSVAPMWASSGSRLALGEGFSLSCVIGLSVSGPLSPWSSPTSGFTGGIRLFDFGLRLSRPLQLRFRFPFGFQLWDGCRRHAGLTAPSVPVD